MILCFPDLATLQLALTSGAVPPTVSQAPVTGGFDDGGRVWVKFSATLPRAAQAELRRLGALTVKSLDVPALEFTCWPQLLPLQREATVASPTAQTPVLFQLATPEQLPVLVGEILRLGNDRQGFRWLGDGDSAPVLLRVVGPPYYSLLRAIDKDGNATAPRAYVERGPRLWVEIGHTHPLMEQLTAPEGKFVLLRPPRDWVYLDEAPFRDIYDILDFKLPGADVRWRDVELDQKMPVAVRLTGGGGQEPAELWVLRERPVEVLDEFVRGADDQLLGRLSFAVGEQDGGERCIVLRVRPSRLAPPVLVLPGQAFRQYLKLPNLFLPVGTRLHPPLRRDAVRRLFADDPDQVTWLYPKDDGRFRPEHLPDSVFRPLSDWIDYVLDHDHLALRAWVQSAQFDFEPFICKDDQDPRSDRPKKGEGRERRPGRRDGEPDDTAAGNSSTPVVVDRSRKKEVKDEALPELPRAAPNELQLQLHALEKRFLDLLGGLDAPERLALWPQLALLNAAIGNTSDATLCYVHALWDESPEAGQWARTWLREENRRRDKPLSARELDRVLTASETSLADVRLLAAAVVSAAQQEPPPAELLAKLRPVQEFLQKHELLLPVRAVWLVALSLYRLSNGDLLALTRTRDRLLERLFKAGLSAEQDLPTFLRFSGARSSDRFRAFRDWLLPLPQKISRWIHEHPAKNEHAKSNAAETGAYANLILAFGLARLGEEQRARQLRDAAREVLGGKNDKDDVHTCLLEAFDYRLHQALDGKPPTGPLPPDQLEYLEQLDRIARYKVDRLRQYSRILEPHEKINPYRSWQVRYFDDLGKKLAALPDIIDRAELEKACVDLLGETRGKGAKDRAQRARVVAAALGVAPRVGEAFARELLPETLPACDALGEVLEQAELLEKGMFVAAHFDQSSHVQALVGRFRSLLATLHGQSGAKLDELAEQCFRGLRKLGMRDEIHELLRKMAEIVTDGKPLAKLREGKEWPPSLRTLLHVAGSWYYFGMDNEAKPVMEQARTLLYQGELDAREQTKLACAYAKTLGQAPVEMALQCIDEMFQNLERISDTFTTNDKYSVSQLSVVEAVVLSVVSEDFALGTMTRRWLDDEEFLIRRRVHADVHGLMGQAHL